MDRRLPAPVYHLIAIPYYAFGVALALIKVLGEDAEVVLLATLSILVGFKWDALSGAILFFGVYLALRLLNYYLVTFLPFITGRRIREAENG